MNGSSPEEKCVGRREFSEGPKEAKARRLEITTIQEIEAWNSKVCRKR